MSVPVPGEPPRCLHEMPTKGRVVVACPENEAAAIKGARGEGCDYFLSPWVEGQVFWIDIDAALSAFTGGTEDEQEPTGGER
jgi:hypothetical protein